MNYLLNAEFGEYFKCYGKWDSISQRFNQIIKSQHKPNAQVFQLLLLLKFYYLF
jgi:hypothetical protein